MRKFFGGLPASRGSTYVDTELLKKRVTHARIPVYDALACLRRSTRMGSPTPAPHLGKSLRLPTCAGIHLYGAITPTASLSARTRGSTYCAIVRVEVGSTPAGSAAYICPRSSVYPSADPPAVANRKNVVYPIARIHPLIEKSKITSLPHARIT